MANLIRKSLLAAFLLISFNAFGAPDIWDDDFGPDTGLVDDDGAISMELGFLFRYDSVDYNTISIGTNGGIVLGIDHEYVDVSEVTYDTWYYDYFEDYFTDAGDPVLLVFNTDLSNEYQGTIHFKTTATEAVVTWNMVASYETDDAVFATFQAKLQSNGTIVYGWDEIPGDLVADNSEGIVVGISNGAGDMPPLSSDLSNGININLDTKTVYEIWCYGEDLVVDGDCFQSDGSRPDNYGFDLVQTNIVFSPNGTGGYDLANAVVEVQPSEPEPLVPYEISGCTLGASDGTVDPTLPLLVLISLAMILNSRSRKARIQG